mgnify:CR=1 FL=1
MAKGRRTIRSVVTPDQSVGQPIKGVSPRCGDGGFVTTKRRSSIATEKRSPVSVAKASFSSYSRTASSAVTA